MLETTALDELDSESSTEVGADLAETDGVASGIHHRYFVVGLPLASVVVMVVLGSTAKPSSPLALETTLEFCTTL